jgi:cytidine diphosphoramidate kinase
MVISFIGLSGAGKSTISAVLRARLKSLFPNVVLLDGDELRNAIAPDLGYTYEDREESEARRSKLCRILSEQGIHVICAGLSNYPQWRAWCRTHIQDYLEVYLNVPEHILHARDVKGIYEKVRNGEMRNVVGFDIAFQSPTQAELVIENTGRETAEEVADGIMRYLEFRGLVHP